MVPLSEKRLAAETDIRQCLILLKHFTVRLFNNDIIKYENQKRESFIALLTILAVSGGVTAFILLVPYLQHMPGYTSETAWIEKTFFITFSMAFTGIISVINWDNIFLDQKDYNYLFGLPVKPAVLFTAKFFSLMTFVGIISLTLNLFGMSTFTVYLEQVPNVNPFYDTGVLAFTLVHLWSVFLANLFIFLFVALVQSLLMLIFNSARYQKISLPVQSLLLMCFISVFAWFPRLHGSLANMKESYSSFVYYFPPIWFVGFYERMLGNYDLVFNTLFYLAASVVILLVDLYLIAMPLSFKRFSGRSSTSLPNKDAEPNGVVSKLWDKIVPKNPLQKAVFHFTLAALSRSRRHKLQLAITISLPLTFVLTESVLIYFNRGAAYFQGFHLFLTAIPLLLYVFLVVGFRTVVLHPVSIEANWVFRITERTEPKHFIRGLKRAFLVVWILPVFTLLFLTFLSFWGFLPALYHSFYSLGAAWLLFELMFLNYRKMPFASVYVPGKARLRSIWYLYVAGFGGYIYGFAVLGAFLLSRPLAYLAYYPPLFLAGYLIRRYRYKLYREFRFVFEEEPDPAMLGLGFDAG
ncbi:MAG: hypothetical protein GY765_13710 [bacterium]|nr:hypothetical protein [bacterium]